MTKEEEQSPTQESVTTVNFALSDTDTAQTYMVKCVMYYYRFSLDCSL